MRMKSVKFSSTPKAIGLLPPPSTKPADSGQLTLVWKFKVSLVTKKIFSHALSITRAILLSLVAKITPAVFGRMRKL
jgi:hypothetical protein